jgi:3D (Asp-Asp-Asp) domain-containing protein
MFSRKFYKSLRRWQFVLACLALVEFIYPHSVLGQRVGSESNSEVLRYQEMPASVAVSDTVASVKLCENNTACRLPDVPSRPSKKSFYVTVTAYSSSVDETDGDPFTTASGSKTHIGVAAYNHLPFGSKFRLPDKFGDQVFTIEDRLRAGAGKYHVDIWMPSKAEAKQWGVKVIKIEIL